MSMSPLIISENAWVPPITTRPSSLRNNLRQAIKLLKSAGWEYNDGALRNKKGHYNPFGGPLQRHIKIHRPRGVWLGPFAVAEYTEWVETP